jgi:hypothetical protein
MPKTQRKYLGKDEVIALIIIILVVSNVWTYSELINTNKKYDILSSFYKELSHDSVDLINLLYSYSSLPEAFSRTLNEESVNEISSTIRNVTEGSTSSWSSIQRIFDYIISNIRYTYTIDMPSASRYYDVNIDGYDYIINFTIETVRNYYQKPSLTIEIKQGNCGDQAILAYAMIKYTLGTDSRLYIAHINFLESEVGHLIVILPVQNGQVCIIDPANYYLTSSEGVIASKPVKSELQTYSNCWSFVGKHITNMTLYDVSIQDGSYSVAVEGTINQIVTFLIQD